MTENHCFICNSSSCSLSCSGCGVEFCCAEHGALHTNTDTGSCHPYTVRYDDHVGRYVVASRDIKQGEVIFGEREPLVVGPNHECPPLCLQCLDPCDLSNVCPGCGYPMCSDQCCSDHQTTEECQLLSRAAAPVFSDGSRSEAYHVILPLRLLITERQDPAKSRLAQLFMDHREDRLKSQYWPYCQEVIVPFIKNILPDTSEDDINRAIGILEVNCYEVKNWISFGVRGFYPLASLLSHSCVANCKTVWQSEAPFGHRTIAVRDIKQGEEILTSYLRSSMCSLTRRRAIREGWYFDCKCRRCCDRTELGTHCNTLLCGDCGSGHVMPRDPLDYDTVWDCDKCEAQMRTEDALEMVEKFNEDIKQLYENDRYNTESWLKLLSQAKPRFHPQHMIMTEISKWLVPILCRGPSLGFSDFPPDLVETKLLLASHYVQVMDVLEPGLSKFRAKFTFELIDTKMFLFCEKFKMDQIAEISEINGIKIHIYKLMIQVMFQNLLRNWMILSRFLR